MKKHIYVSIAIGLLVGLLCKLVDFCPGNTWIGYLGIIELFNYLGLFVIITCLIEYTAPTIKCGFFQTLGFMMSMVFSYYATTFIVYKSIPYRYVLLWSIVALCSSLLCWIISQRRKSGLVALLGVLIPILLLGSETYKLIEYGSHSPILIWIEITAIIIMFWKLPQNNKHRIFSIIAFAFLIPFLDYLDVANVFIKLCVRLLF